MYLELSLLRKVNIFLIKYVKTFVEYGINKLLKIAIVCNPLTISTK